MYLKLIEAFTSSVLSGNGVSKCLSFTMPATVSLLSQSTPRKRKLTDDEYKPSKKSKPSAAAILSTRNNEDCIDSALTRRAMDYAKSVTRTSDRSESPNYHR